VVNPATMSAAVWTHGSLRPMPPTVMGIPADVDALAGWGIVTDGLKSHVVPMPEEDVSVADYVVARLGQDVLDRLVEPLPGGGDARDARRLSLRAPPP